MDKPTCAACGVPYEDHLGLQGTCQILTDLRRVIDQQAVTIHKQAREILALRELRARHRDALGYNWYDSPTRGAIDE